MRQKALLRGIEDILSTTTTERQLEVRYGDAQILAEGLDAESVQTIITSPPYFKLRDYGISGELGKEKSLQEYVERLVDIFRALKPALKKDGTVWLNLGDTYEKTELMGVPWKAAFALKEDGWILRSDIIWHKPNAMPSPARNRPTTDHEYIFLFAKSKNYYYDADSIREPHVTFSSESKMRGGRNHLGKKGGTPENGKFSGYQKLHSGDWDTMFHPKGRNKRTVWSVPLGKFREAHFAVFSEKLITPCVQAGSQKGDLVVDPFSGSGTTGIVAGKFGRRYIGFEINPTYVDLSRKRLSEVQPTLLFDS
jgi:site-specific DNA-methyltransferase (adenine-specific)